MTRLPKSIIKKYGISKKAWQVFRGRKSKGSSSKTTRSVSMKRKRRYPRFRRFRRRMPKTIPIAPIAGLAAGFVLPAWQGGPSVVDLGLRGDYKGALNEVIKLYTGYNPYHGNWDIMNAKGLHYLFYGIVAHKICNWIGVNRMFNRLPSPINKLRI